MRERVVKKQVKRRRLGQHYLVDLDVVGRIISLADVKPTEKVLEIGTGRGVITKGLAGRGASLTGYEVDEGNFKETVRVAGGSGVRLVHADAFSGRPEFDVLVSSLPYSESVRFVRWLSTVPFDRAVVVLQEDFVRKVLAPPGAREYRGVSALAQLCFEIGIVERVQRGSFSPQPKVSSVIASIKPKLRVSSVEVANVFRLFSLRRRQVGSALAELGMGSPGSFGTRRVVSLMPEEVHRLCRPAAS